MRKKLLLWSLAIIASALPAIPSLAQIPDGYYNSLKGKKGAELKTAIYNIIKDAKVLGYGSGKGKTWWGFWDTDRDERGYFIDRYSAENEWEKSTSQGDVGTGMNIEHSFPKSWWGGASCQAYKDLYNLMPCEKTINTTKQGINDNEDYINAQKKLIANAKEWGETIKKGYSAVLDIVTELGADEDSLGYELAQAGESVIDLIVNVITLQAQFKILGVAANSALAIVGWIAMALQTIAELISLVLGQHDRSLQRQIETIEDRVERLQKSFEKLEKAIDNAYDVSRLKRWKDSAESNLRQQIAATQKMIDLEEDKKKSDKDKIKDWQNDIESMQEQLKELQDNFYQSLGAFGSDEQYKDAAESFADAWYSSINDTGEGISGLEDTFNEFMDNVVKKQLLMRGSQRILEPLLKMIDASVEDGIVTADEMQRVQNEFNDKTKYALDEYYKTIYDLYDGMLGVGGDLSDLQKGISSITEPQAAAIEAYLNTIRFFVSKIYESSKVLEQNTKYMQDNPLLAELQAQTTILRDIYDTLRSVVGRGNNSVHTGAYIKVLA